MKVARQHRKTHWLDYWWDGVDLFSRQRANFDVWVYAMACFWVSRGSPSPFCWSLPRPIESAWSHIDFGAVFVDSSNKQRNLVANTHNLTPAAQIMLVSMQQRPEETAVLMDEEGATAPRDHGIWHEESVFHMGEWSSQCTIPVYYDVTNHWFFLPHHSGIDLRCLGTPDACFSTRSLCDSPPKVIFKKRFNQNEGDFRPQHEKKLS